MGLPEQEAALSAAGQGQALGAEQRKGEASRGAGTGGRALWTPGSLLQRVQAVQGPWGSLPIGSEAVVLLRD